MTQSTCIITENNNTLLVSQDAVIDNTGPISSKVFLKIFQQTELVLYGGKYGMSICTHTGFQKLCILEASIMATLNLTLM